MISEEKLEKKYWLISFVLALLCMYILFVFTGLSGFGDRSIINGDLKDNYIPAIRNLCRDIFNGQSIYYTWTYGLGINTSLYNAYYSYSPLNVLYLLFYYGDMNSVTVTVIVIKAGLAAMCFQLFISKSYKVNGIFSVIFSLFYALCSFQIAFNVQNIIWLDAVIALPVIFGCVNSLCYNGKMIWLALAYAFIFTSQFYMGYMIGIASFMYFVACLFMYTPKEERKLVFGKYVVAGCLAVGLSAWVWLPMLFFMPESVSTGLGFFSSLGTNVLDIFNQFFWGEVSDFDALFPYIYCGIPSVVLGILYFFNKSNSVAEKIGHGVIVVFMICSCIFSPLYALWHGFEEPNSFAFRFAYIISFMMCTLAAVEAQKLTGANGKKLLFLLVGMIVLYVVEMFYQGTWVDVKKQSNNWGNFAINVIFIALWIAVGICYCKFKNRYSLYVSVLLVFLAMVEVISNGYHILGKGNKISIKLTDEAYYTWDICEKWVINELEKDDSLYRVCYWQDLSPSSGINYGYNSLSYFGSADNALLRNVLGRLGLYQSPRIVCNFGVTSVTKMLLGVKYDAYGEKPVEKEDGTIGYTVALEENELALGMGYMVAGAVEDYDCFSTNAFENNNSLLTTMTGKDMPVFEPVDPLSISVTGTGLNLSNDGEHYILEYVADEEENKNDVNISFHISENGKKNYAYIENETSIYAADTYLLTGGEENKAVKYGRVSVSYMKELLEEENGSVLRIEPDGFFGQEYFDDIYFYSLNEEKVRETFADLSKEQLVVTEYGDGYVRGHVSVTGSNRILFTSIPYEKGWTAYVNGEKYDVSPIVYNTFIAIELPDEGDYEIVLKFAAPGVKAGFCLSALSAIVVLAMLALLFNKSRRQDELVSGIDVG